MSNRDIGRAKGDPITASQPEEPEPTECQWFYLCDHEATRTEPHPILGDVPICQRCTDKLRRIEDMT